MHVHNFHAMTVTKQNKNLKIFIKYTKYYFNFSYLAFSPINGIKGYDSVLGITKAKAYTIEVRFVLWL